MVKIVKESKLPSWDEILSKAPKEIVDLIEKSKTTQQSPKWHPENEVYNHIKIVYNRAQKSGDINLLLSSLFHDLGKMLTTKLNKKGKWSAYGHEAISSKLVEKYKEWIDSMGADWFQVFNIVKEHMRIKIFNEMRLIKQEQLRQNQWFDKINQFASFDDMSNLTDEEKNINI